MGLVCCVLSAFSLRLEAQPVESRLLLRLSAGCDLDCEVALRDSLQPLGLLEWRALRQRGLALRRAHSESGRDAADRIRRSRLLRFATGIAPELLCRELGGRAGVELVEVDVLGAGAGIPNDSWFSQQWAMYNPDGPDIEALLAWPLSEGNEDVVIAVLDTGVSLQDADFSSKMVDGYDFVNGDAFPIDDNGHGSNVASLALASGNNAHGIIGVCPRCSLMPVKVLDANNYGYYSWWAEGLIFAADHGARVVNLSLGGLSPSETLQAGIDYAEAAGVVLVAAMMNTDDETPHYPAVYRSTIAVGATDRQDRRASPFGWGGGSCYGAHIDLVAPGDDMLGISSVQGVTRYSGTSQATPLVSGTVGLLLSLQPSLDAAQVRTILRSSAQDRVGASEEDRPGFDIFYGAGRLSTFAALRSLGLWADADQDGYPEPVDCDDADPLVLGEGPWGCGAVVEPPELPRSKDDCACRLRGLPQDWSWGWLPSLLVALVFLERWRARAWR
jgi:hypothetical protein